MIKAGILSVLAAVFLSILLFNCSPSLNSDRTAPRVENGVLDLSRWDLKNDGPVALDGKWEFYWHRHLEPNDFSDETPPTGRSFIEVPATWNGHVINGQKISGNGYATYRLKIHLTDNRQMLAFKFLDMATSFCVYLDGKKLISSGVPGKTLESTTPRFLPQVVEFTPGSKQLQVVIQISNFHHRKGGVWEPILLGMSKDIWQIRQNALNLDIFLFGGILMMGLYHISLFIIRAKDKSTLLFGIFCFLIAIRSLVTGERYLVGLWPDFSWEGYTKIAYLTFYVAAPVLAMYFRCIFPQDISKYFIYLMIIVSAVFSVIVLLTPARIYSNTIPLFQIFTVLASCYGFYRLILAFIRKRQGSFICLAGFVVLFLTIVNDILYSNLLIQTGYMLQVGFFIFLIFQALLLSIRFSKAFETVDLQHQTLEDTNAAYKKEILERKRTQEALAESEEKYRMLVENASDAIVVARDGMLCFVNSRAIEISGYSEKELKSNPFLSMVHPQDRDRVRQNYYNRLNGKLSPVSYAFRCLQKDGGIKWLELNSVRISWEGMPATLNFLRDITEKHLLEEELIKAQKLEAIGVLAGGIAHDFNNILAMIMGNVSLAKTNIRPNDKIHHLLAEAEKASIRAKALTRRLLTFSKGGEPVKEVTTIPEVIVGCSTFALSGSKVGCEFNFPADLWPIKIDVGQINQAIQNIIINADQAMPGGGKIKIGAANITVDSNRRLPLPPGKYVVLTFQDSGVGIPQVYLSKIFDPFFTSKENGSGMGLTTAYSIIKRHDGHIAVASEIGVGTTFSVYLPSTKEKIPAKVETAEIDIHGKGKILAMDDEEMIRDLIKLMLHRMGYEVELAKDGKEAIGLYQEALDAGKPFDAVILDLTVPGAMGGKEAIARLYEVDSRVKAIVSSGYSVDPVMSNYKKYGFCAVVEKPFNLQKLGTTLDKVLK